MTRKSKSASAKRPARNVELNARPVAWNGACTCYEDDSHRLITETCPIHHSAVIPDVLPSRQNTTVSKPALEPRLVMLGLDVYELISGAVISAQAGVPYCVAREATKQTDAEREWLYTPAQRWVTAHADFVAEHEAGLSAGIGLSAIQAKKFESLMLSIAGERQLELKEVLALIVLMIAPPLLIVALILLFRRER